MDKRATTQKANVSKKRACKRPYERPILKRIDPSAVERDVEKEKVQDKKS
jgi:hypothetical protein